MKREHPTLPEQNQGKTLDDQHDRGMPLVFAAHIRLPGRQAHTHQIMQMCEAFADEGASVTLLTAGVRRKQEGAGDLWRWYGVKRNFTIEALPAPDLSGLTTHLPARLRHGGLTLAWRTSLIFFTVRLLQRLRRLNDAIVYSRDAFPLWAISNMRRGSAHRCFYEAHTCPTTGVGARLQRGLARRIGGMVAVTRHLHERLEKIGAAPDKTLVAHDGVRLDRFDVDMDRQAVRSHLGWPEQAFIVGYAGRTQTLGHDKGLDVLAEGVLALRARMDEVDVRLALVGGAGEQTEGLQRRMGARGLSSDALIAHGWVPPTELPYMLKAFDVCALPLPWTEHFAYDASPLKLFEYMACGRPIVASDLPAVREVLRDGENAILTPPSDVRALTDALSRLLRDPALGERLSAQAWRDVKVFSWADRAQRILAMIQTAVR